MDFGDRQGGEGEERGGDDEGARRAGEGVDGGEDYGMVWPASVARRSSEGTGTLGPKNFSGGGVRRRRRSAACVKRTFEKRSPSGCDELSAMDRWRWVGGKSSGMLEAKRAARHTPHYYHRPKRTSTSPASTSCSRPSFRLRARPSSFPPPSIADADDGRRAVQAASWTCRRPRPLPFRIHPLPPPFLLLLPRRRGSFAVRPSSLFPSPPPSSESSWFLGRFFPTRVVLYW